MDMNQLMQALRNADAAGDTQAASRIAQMIQNQRQQQTAAPAQDRNVAENLGTGMMDRVYAIGEGLTNLLPTVTKAITGMENPRIFVDTGDDGFQFSDLKNIQMRDDKDFRQMRKTHLVLLVLNLRMQPIISQKTEKH